MVSTYMERKMVRPGSRISAAGTATTSCGAPIFSATTRASRPITTADSAGENRSPMPSAPAPSSTR